MRTPAVPIFLMLTAGTIAALYLPGGSLPWLAAGAVAAWQLALLAFVTSRLLLFIVAALASIALSGSAAALHTDWQRRHAAVLAWAAPSRGAEPVAVEAVIVDDGSMRVGGGAALHVRVERVRGAPVEGGVMLSIAGDPDPALVRAWTRGRRIRAPVVLRRPARYRNDGVADSERAAMRRGIALTGSIKSAALVEIVARGSRLQEGMARARAFVRDAVTAATRGDPDAGAIVTAILIGDRAGLADDIERRMQRAGTYHVIAISGGNIALFAALAWTACRVLVRSRRAALVAAMLMIASYGVLVGTGASVARAVAAALLFLLTTLLDHRAPPLNVIAVVGAGFLLWDPLAIVDLGFLLSFGATVGIILAVPPWQAAFARWIGSSREARPAVRVAFAIASMIAATAAAEISLLPVQAAAFQRLTVAGLFLNIVAIPAMAVIQIGGMAIVACAWLHAPLPLHVAAIAAQAGARALVDSAVLVDRFAFSTWRVAAPPDWLIASYLAACMMLAWRRWPRLRKAAAAIALAAGLAIATSSPKRAPADRRLRLSLFDVGQAEAILVKLPSGRSVLVDAAGASGRFDIGDRVLVPALLARGVTRLDWFVLTHADLDHIGGAASVITDLRPSRVLEGVAIPRHPDRNRVMQMAAAAGASIEALRAGGSLMLDGVLFSVLHPPDPDWERQDVRNDDSVVIDVRFGAVSILLTGDAGEAVEPSIAARLLLAPLRILKAGHHGSRTATSQAWLDAARPTAALISAGRDNVYGHPSSAVLARLRRAGIETFRTDEEGQIDLTTDGKTVEIATWRGRSWGITARQSHEPR